MSDEKKTIEEFMCWYKSSEERFREDFVVTKLRQHPLATVEQAGADFETEYVLATFNIWGWGDFEVIVVCKRTNETIFADDLRIVSAAELSKTLDHYYNRIAAHLPC
jgi:hypothetical protein